MRRITLACALVLAGLAMAGGLILGAERGGSSHREAERVYVDRRFGFTVRAPEHLRLVPFHNLNLRLALSGVAVSNRRLPLRLLEGDLRALGRRSVFFKLEHRGGGPGPALDLPELRFPLSSRGFPPPDRSVSSYLPGVELRRRTFSANGYPLVAIVAFGPDAAARDRRAIWDVVSSLRFRRLPVGERTGDGFTVLGPAGAYRIGSVSRVAADEFLVRAPHGFYGIVGQTLGSRLPCSVHVERGPSFACDHSGWRWNRVGRPLWPSASELDALAVLTAKVRQDGHVLLTPNELRFGTRRLERRLWGGVSG